MSDGPASLDLSPLESAAKASGLPGMTARVVPRDARRGTWFSWEGTDLRVSEAVVERCPPADAVALLVDAIHEWRGLRSRRHVLWIAGVVVLALVAVLGGGFSSWLMGGLAGLGGTLGLFAWWSAERARLRMAADDLTVRQLGSAESLVRGFNFMNQEELRLAGRRLPARPDLHPRAERLIRIHGLACAEHGGSEHGGLDHGGLEHDGTRRGGPEPGADGPPGAGAHRG